jgi:hypothetical protein
MRVVIQPFFSQQDKGTGRFLLDADVTVQISRFLAEQLRGEGMEVRVLDPDGLPHDNKLQRLSFDVEAMSEALRGCDLFITHNELAASRARHLTRAKIVHFNHMMPLGGWEWMAPLQRASWAAADLVVFLSESLRSFAGVPGTVWPMVYDQRHIRSYEDRPIDVLFVQRCSVSNYTHHREFLAADLSGLRTVFTDPTRYLELHENPGGVEFAHCDTRESYYELLGRSKVAVALMTDDLHGGVAVREAVVSGCVPVLLDRPCYREMAGDQPVFTDLDPENIARTVRTALHGDASSVRERVSRESYQQAWLKARSDIWMLLSEQ